MKKSYGKIHTVDSALRTVSRKRDIKIKGRNIQKLVGPKAHKDIGLKTLGKLDFLKNNGFHVIEVESF